MSPLIAPSILSADFFRLGEEIETVLQAGAGMIHFDVMDNHYVPNLSFGSMILKSLRQNGIKAPIDVHLMTYRVESLIDRFISAGADYISFHPEATPHVDRCLQKIKDAGCKAGIALNPSTGLEVLEYVWDKLDMIVVMSVNPGFGGQSFIPASLEKIARIRARIDQSKHPIRLEVDGGLNQDNIARIAQAGADTFVAGSAIFGKKDYRAAINTLIKNIEKTKE